MPDKDKTFNGICFCNDRRTLYPMDHEIVQEMDILGTTDAGLHVEAPESMARAPSDNMGPKGLSLPPNTGFAFSAPGEGRMVAA